MWVGFRFRGTTVSAVMGIITNSWPWWKGWTPALEPTPLRTRDGAPSSEPLLPPRTDISLMFPSCPVRPGHRGRKTSEMGAGGLLHAARTHIQVSDSRTSSLSPCLSSALAGPCPLLRPATMLWVMLGCPLGGSRGAMGQSLPRWDLDFLFSSRLQAVGGFEHRPLEGLGP